MNVTAPAPDELDAAARALPGEARVFEAAQSALRGERHGLRALWPFLGPAFVAAVAYVDPGNFATNVAGGARYGYMLLWVVLAANLMAMLVQTLSAKLGIATGMNLCEVCRERFPRPVTVALWLQAEVIAMATDLAEFLGAALGLYLLFGIPLFVAALMTGVAVFAILALQSRGFRALEAVITVLVGMIMAAFAFEVFIARPSPGGVAQGLLLPRLSDTQSLLIAVGILGATVMPHVVYLHSALTQRRVVGRDERDRQRIFKFEKWDVIIAMSIAGVINLSMLTTIAAAFYSRGLTDLQGIDQAYRGLGQVLGRHADLLFGMGLLASGLSASSVGTMAGQVVMQGFIRRRIPLFLRRTVTMIPALIIVGLGTDPSRALVISQVVLSFGIPFAVIPLVIFSRDPKLMGSLVNSRLTTIAATAMAVVIVSLNVFLLARLTVFGGS